MNSKRPFSIAFAALCIALAISTNTDASEELTRQAVGQHRALAQNPTAPVLEPTTTAPLNEATDYDPHPYYVQYRHETPFSHHNPPWSFPLFLRSPHSQVWSNHAPQISGGAGSYYQPPASQPYLQFRHNQVWSNHVPQISRSAGSYYQPSPAPYFGQSPYQGNQSLPPLGAPTHNVIVSSGLYWQK